MTTTPRPLPDVVDVGSPVCLTGHRPGDRAGGGHGRYRDGAWAWVRDALPRVLDRLQPAVVWTGGALGFDQLGAWLAVEGGHPVGIATPFDGFDARWPDMARKRLRWLSAQAQHVVTVCEPGYAPWKLHARNDYLLDRATIVIALWDGREGGGTADTVAKARNRRHPVVHLHPHQRSVSWLLPEERIATAPQLLVPPDDSAPPA